MPFRPWLTLLAATVGVVPAAAASGGERFDDLEASGAAQIDAPAGLTAMCTREPELCDALRGDGAAMAAARLPIDHAGQLKLLRRINIRVNRAVRQRTDARVFGSGEWWTRPGTARGAAGDCEDLAIEKRAALIEAGWDPAALYFAIGYRRGLGMHAVLVARTGQGDVVLDSLTPYVKDWRKTPYLWVGREVAGQLDNWRSAMPIVPDMRMAAIDAPLTTGATTGH